MVSDARPIPNPLFDDEDLPAWLKEGGVTFLGRVAAHDTGGLVDFVKAPWETTAPDNSPAAPSADAPAWIEAAAGPSTPMDPDEGGPSVDVPAWMQAQPVAQPAAPPAPKAKLPPPPVNKPPVAADDSFDDLRGFYGDPELPPETPEPLEPATLSPASPPGEPIGAFSDAEMRLDFLDDLPEFRPDAAATTADVPDWMRQGNLNNDLPTDADEDLLQALAQTSGPPSAKISRTVNDIDNPEAPDWLRGLSSPGSETPGLQSTDGDLDWLADLDNTERASTGAGPLPPPPPPTSDKLPAWLRGLDPTTEEGRSKPTSTDKPAAQPAAATAISPVPVAKSPAAALPTSFPATGITPEKLSEKMGGPKKEDSLSSADIDALLSLAPVSLDLPEPPTPPSGFDTPWDGEAADRDALAALSDDWAGTASALVPLQTTEPPFSASTPTDPTSSLDALSDVSFEDTTLDEMLGPPSAAIRVGPQAFTLPPDEIPPAPPSEPVVPSLMNRPGGLRKLPRRDEEPIPLPDAAAISGELPEFVQEMRPADAPVELTIGGVQIGVKEEPLSKLSDSLRQLRDRARETSPTPAPPKAGEGPATVTEGALAEIAGVITPVQLKIEAPAVTPSQAIASDMQMKRVQLMQSLLEIDESPQSASAQIKRANRRRFGLDRMFIAVLLFAVIALPFFNSTLNVMIPPDASITTAPQKSAFAVLDGIGRAQPVIMAFEYGSSGAGELDDLARVLLRELFAHGAKPIIVSTNAIGALHAEALLTAFGRDKAELQRLNRVGLPLTARVDFVLLRYLPAGAAGVRSLLNAVYQPGFETDTQFLTTDLEGKPTGLTAADVIAAQRAPVIVFGESAEDVRNWAEQYRPTSGQKLLLAVSVAADATARTYAASSPALIAGPLVGLRDALLFPALRRQSVAPADATLGAQRWQSTGLGALAAGLIILLGSTASIIGALRKRGRPSQEAAR